MDTLQHVAMCLKKPRAVSSLRTKINFWAWFFSYLLFVHVMSSYFDKKFKALKMNNRYFLFSCKSYSCTSHQKELPTDMARKTRLIFLEIHINSLSSTCWWCIFDVFTEMWSMYILNMIFPNKTLHTKTLQSVSDFMTLYYVMTRMIDWMICWFVDLLFCWCVPLHTSLWTMCKTTILSWN